jgi:hypothetical protein
MARARLVTRVGRAGSFFLSSGENFGPRPTRCMVGSGRVFFGWDGSGLSGMTAHDHICVYIFFRKDGAYFVSSCTGFVPHGPGGYKSGGLVGGLLINWLLSYGPSSFQPSSFVYSYCRTYVLFKLCTNVPTLQLKE